MIAKFRGHSVFQPERTHNKTATEKNSSYCSKFKKIFDPGLLCNLHSRKKMDARVLLQTQRKARAYFT